MGKSNLEKKLNLLGLSYSFINYWGVSICKSGQEETYYIGNTLLGVISEHTYLRIIANKYFIIGFRALITDGVIVDLYDRYNTKPTFSTNLNECAPSDMPNVRDNRSGSKLIMFKQPIETDSGIRAFRYKIVGENGKLTTFISVYTLEFGSVYFDNRIGLVNDGIILGYIDDNCILHDIQDKAIIED